jgi:hypothetical protein
MKAALEVGTNQTDADMQALREAAVRFRHAHRHRLNKLHKRCLRTFGVNFAQRRNTLTTRPSHV